MPELESVKQAETGGNSKGSPPRFQNVWSAVNSDLVAYCQQSIGFQRETCRQYSCRLRTLSSLACWWARLTLVFDFSMNLDQRPVELSIMHFPFLELDSQPRPVESESHDVGPRNVHFKYTPPCPLVSLMHVWEPLRRPSKYDSTSQMCGTSSLRGRYCVGREGWEKSVSLIAIWEGVWGPGWKGGGV